MSAYYFVDDWSQNNPYPVAQGGANVPGFNALYLGRAQLISLGDTKSLGATAVNEFHFSYLRNAIDLGKPVGGVGVSLDSQGFVTGAGNAGNRGALSEERRSGERGLQQLHFRDERQRAESSRAILFSGSTIFRK